MNYKSAIRNLVKQYEEEYKKFMGIGDFPKYELELFKIDLENSDESGFGILAQAKYNFDTGKHILRVCTSFEGIEFMKYIIFHEFTHILDSEIYVEKDVSKYIYLSGYTEYHASQVELMVLLGADNINSEDFSFSVNNEIETVTRKMRVEEYVSERHQFVVDMIRREDFPASFDTLKSTIGILYNYYGLRSICKMYGNDYIEHVNNSAILEIMPSDIFYALNTFMNGHFNKGKVELSYGLFSNILMPIAKEKNFLK